MGLLEKSEIVLYGDAFRPKNNIDELINQLNHHPKYFECFAKTDNILFKGDGPLPYTHRYYIAIMAAAQHQCIYLVEHYKDEFAMNGGDLQWLKGLSHIPEKLQMVNQINKILAHEPWLLEKSHIEMLTKAKDNWSLSEVMQAMVLMSHVHALSSFVLACGLSRCGSQQALTREGHKPSNLLSTRGILSCAAPEASLLKCMLASSPPAAPMTDEERNRALASLLALDPMDGGQTDNLPALNEEMCSFGSELPEAGRCRLRDGLMLRAQDCSWETHGYSLLNRLYGESGLWLDERFKMAANLTYHTLGSRQVVDTGALRQALWNYVQCTLGVRHDDCDYGQVASLLKEPLRAFLKAACCWPERLAPSDLNQVLGELHYSERVHILVVVSEARMQVELLYAIRALMKYMAL